MTWTYNLHGRPDTSLGVLSVLRDEDPGHILMIERTDGSGTCDGYFIRVQNHDTQTAEYDWVASGAPDQVVPALLGQVTQKADKDQNRPLT